MWFADDATGCGPLTSLREWWDLLLEKGPHNGCYPSSVKTYLVVPPELVDATSAMFAGTNIKITSHGRRHLGAAIGTPSFVEEYVSQKVTEWVAELDRLSQIATCHPQAAYNTIVYGLRGKWLYLAWTLPDVADLFHPLEIALRSRFIPALTSGASPGRWSALCYLCLLALVV